MNILLQSNFQNYMQKVLPDMFVIYFQGFLFLETKQNVGFDTLANRSSNTL